MPFGSRIPSALCALTISYLVTGCVSLSPTASPESVEQLKRAGEAYAVVRGTELADSADAREACVKGTLRPTFQHYCSDLSNYVVATSTVAATSGKSSLKVLLMIPKIADVKKNDIVKFRFGTELEFIGIASRGEREHCKWVGSSELAIGFPFQEGGIECDGWSYKTLMDINWKPVTWFPF